jgi:invasin B
MASIYLSQPDMALVAQQMTLLPEGSGAFASAVKTVEADLLRFDSQQMNVEGKALSVDMPQLIVPMVRTQPEGSPGAHASPQSTLVGILAQLGNLMADVSLNTMEQRAAHLAAIDQGKIDRLGALGQGYHDKVDLAQQAVTDVAQASTTVLSAQETLKEAQANLLAHPDDPAAQAEVTRCQTVVADAQVLCVAQTEYAQQALDDADRLYAQLTQDVGYLDTEQTIATGVRHLDAGAKLAGIMAQLSNAIGDSLDKKLVAQAEQSQQIQNGRIEKEKTESEQRAKESAKQQAVSKGVNCAMKILGALLTAVSAVSAVFTGGASLALAAVGVAMMIADTVAEKVTGTSLTERMMQPLMEHVLKPLIDILSKMVTGILEDFGVPKEKAEQVGHIIGAVLGTALFAVVAVAAVVLSKNVAEKLLKPLLKMAEKMISKMVPQLMKDLGAEASALVSKAFSRIGRSIESGVSKLGGREQIASVMDKGVTVMRLGQSVTSGATAIVTADMQIKIAKWDQMIKDMENLDLLDSLAASSLAKKMKAALAILNNLNSSMSDVVAEQTRSRQYMLNHLAV